jgi:oligopeptide/dipeptide ABC transporter ATP-binding protein
MYGGLMLDEGDTKHLLEHSVHPYTRGLIKCAASLKGDEIPLYQLDGYPVTPADYQMACPFFERCERRMPVCNNGIPRIETIGSERFRCCHPYV